MKYLLVGSICFGLFACTSDAGDDSSMYLTGTEEVAVEQEDGTFNCESPRKVLICHIPPGNPDNAHTICVGASAVEAHQRNHDDPIGACDDGGGDDGGDDDGGDDGTGDDGTGDDGGDDGTGDDGGDDGTGDGGDDGGGDDGGGDDGGDGGDVY